MTVDIATLAIRIDSMEAREATRNLDRLREAGGRAEQSTGILTRAFQALAAVTATLKIIDLARESAMLAARFETMGVVLGVAGNNAGYTRNEMADLEKQMTKTGISMIKSREVLTSMATANIDLANATKLARAAQDLAVVGNINSSEATARLISGIQSGEVEVLRSLGLNVNFENSYKKLAMQLHTTTDKLSENQKMTARTNIALSEAAKYAGIYEESLGTAGKAINSLSRYWEDLKVKAGEAFLPALSDGVFKLTDALKAANVELDKAGSDGTISRIGQGLGTAFKIVYETVMVLGANVAFAFSMIAGEIATIATQAVALAHLDFKAAKGIGEEWVKESTAARAALDAFEKKILGVGETEKAVSAESVAAAKAAASAKEQERIAAGAAARAAQAAEEKALKSAADLLAVQKSILSARLDMIRHTGEVEKNQRNELLDAVGELNRQGLISDASYYQVRYNDAMEAGAAQARIIQAEINAAHQFRAKDYTERVENAAKIAKLEAQKTEALRAAGAAAAKLTLAYSYDKDKGVRDAQEASIKEIAAINDSVDAMQRKIDTYGKLESAITRKTIADLEERKAALEQFGGADDVVAGIDARIEALSRLGDAQQKFEGMEKWAGIWKSIDQTAHDTFVSIFDSGKSAFDRLRDTLKNGLLDLLYQMTVKKWIFNIGASVTGSGMAGAAQAADGGSSVFGSAMNLYSAGKTMYAGFTSGIASTIGGSIASLGSMIGSSAVSAFGAGMSGIVGFGPTAAGAATGIGSLAAGQTVAAGASTAAGAAGAGAAGASSAAAVPIVGWVIAAMATADALYKKGWDATNGTLSTAGKIVGAGTMLMDKFHRAIGMSNTAANIFSGQATVSKLFGRKNPEVENFGIEGRVNAGGITGNSYQNILEEGGWFRSDKRYKQTADLDSGVKEMMSGTFDVLLSSVKAVGASLGLEASRVEGYSKAFTLALTTDEAKNQEAIAAMFVGMGEDMAKAALTGSMTVIGAFDPAYYLAQNPDVAKNEKYGNDAAGHYRDYGKAEGRQAAASVTTVAGPDYSSALREGETYSAALQRLSGSLVAVNGMLDTLGVNLLDASVAGGAMASSLVDLFGGLDAMKATSASYFQNYYSEQEKVDIGTRQLAKTFADLGFVMPAATEAGKAALRAQIETELARGEAGQKSAVQLMGLSAPFASLSSAAQQLNPAIAGLGVTIKSAADIASERVELQTQLDALTMSSAELASRARDAIDPLNQSIYDMVQAAEKAAAVTTKQGELDIELMTAQGNAAGLLAKDRRDELAALTLLSPALAKFKQGIYDTLDATKARTTQGEIHSAYATDTQKISEAMAALKTGFADLHLSIPQSAADFLELSDGAKAGTAEGQALIAALDALRPAFNTVQADIAARAQQAIDDAKAAAARADADASAAASAAQQRASESAQAVAAIMSQRTGMELTLYNLTHTAAEQLAHSRGLELAAMAPTLRALQGQIYAQQDLATAATAAKDAAEAAVAAAAEVSKANMDTAKSATDAALAGVQRAIDAEKKRIGVIRDAASESVRSIQGVFDTLKSSVAELYGTVASTAAMQSQQGNQFIDNALRAAQTTGYLPDSKELGEAIAAARGGLTSAEFATQFEADKAALVMAGKLSQLRDLAGPQLSASEQALQVANDQLAALDVSLTLAQAQVDSTNGVRGAVDTGTLTVTAAIAALASALSTQKALVGPTPAGGGDVGWPLPSNLSSSYSYEQSVLDNAAGVLPAITSIPYAASPVVEPTSEYEAIYNSVFAAGRLPAFADGGYYSGGMALVGEDGPELINFNQPGQVYTAPQTRSFMGGGNTERLERLVEALTVQNQRLETRLASIETNTSRTANAVNGQSEQPMLVETV